MGKKRLDFEMLRLMAIVGVVFNHTQLRGFELYQLSGGGINHDLSLLLGILCKTAVPLFLLVSGGLLLHREEPVIVVLKKRAGRTLSALMLFSLVLYSFWTAWGSVDSPGVGDFLSRMWGSGISTPYWYLYAYLGLMLMLPFLRPMVQHMPDRAFQYLLALHIIMFGLLYSLGAILGWGPVNDDLWLPVIEPTLFYYLMGYYLAHRFDWTRIHRRELLLMVLASIVSVAVIFALARLRIRQAGDPGDYLKTLLAVPVFTLYAIVNRLFAAYHPPKWLEGLLVELGGCTFGTYLLEGILRHYLSPVYEALEPRIHVLPACMIWVLAVVLAGLAVTWGLKKVPLLRKIL